MIENIVLIGFMGVGKGTIARALSKKTGIFAIDTDDLIESMENRSIKKIFEKQGEAYFRDLEKKTALWLARNVQKTIISTGGGFYRVPNLKNIGKIIYLQSSFEAIYERLKTHPNSKAKLQKRPLFKNPKKAKLLFNERVKEYERVSHICVNVENRHIKDTLENLIKYMNI